MDIENITDSSLDENQSEKEGNFTLLAIFILINVDVYKMLFAFFLFKWFEVDWMYNERLVPEIILKRK